MGENLFGSSTEEQASLNEQQNIASDGIMDEKPPSEEIKPKRRFGKKNRIRSDKEKKKPSKKQIIAGVVCLAVIGGATTGIVIHTKNAGKTSNEYESLKVERKDIIRTVEGSSTVGANDSYNVTALVQGEILSDSFNEGDSVTKDQVLYVIDSSDAQKKVDSAQNSLLKAEQNYTDAVKKKADTVETNAINEKTQKNNVDKANQSVSDQQAANNESKKTNANSITKALQDVASAERNYETAKKTVGDLTVVSDITGTISEVLVNEGDNVNDGTKLANVYDDSKLKLQIPFNEADANGISVGAAATVTVASTSDSLSGNVESIAGATTATDSHAVVKYVTIVVNNPGGLKAGTNASATVGNAACSGLGTFENYSEGSITAKTSGTLDSLWLEKNDHIVSGQTVGYITSDTATNNLKSAQESVNSSNINLQDAYTKSSQSDRENSTALKNARLSLDEAVSSLEKMVIEDDTYNLDSSISNAKLDLDNARLSLEEAEDNLDDYSITAPIEGTIVTKNKKAGEKLEQNSSSTSEAMAVIYDMSVLKVQLTIDESEIRDIEVGQDVTVTADAVEGEFQGKVTKVGVNGTSSNGVTTYPVDIEIAEYGDLLPGMNVDCVIQISSAENVLAVPVQAIQRGNKVYLKGDKTDENDKAPEGYHSVDVETGATDSQYIEIKSGLEEGDEVAGATAPTGVEAQGSGDADETQEMPGGMGGGPGGMGGGPSGGGGGGRPGGGGGGPM